MFNGRQRIRATEQETWREVGRCLALPARVPFPCQGRQVHAAKSIKAGRQAAKKFQGKGIAVLFEGRQALCMALRLGAGRALRQAGRQAAKSSNRVIEA